MKKVISLFLAVVCMISIFSTMTFTASAATANAKVSEVSKVTIQNVGTGQYLNFDYGTLSNGTYVRVWPWDGSTEQLWSIDHVSGSTYRILTYKSSKYCLDIYRGYSKLKSGQKCDIWKTADDTVAQNLTFYRCDDGSYILRMANNSNLALAATASKDRVKLATFNASSKSQKWIFKDAKGNKIDIAENTVSTSSSTGITSSAYKKTGVVYTVSGTSYYQAKTTRAYNGVAKDSVFYVDSKGAVVNNATVLNKLYSLELFNNIRSNQQSAASLWASAADDYYDICTTVAKNEKMGSLIGKTSGVLLSVGAGNSFGIQEAALEVGGEVCSPETVKTAVLLGMLRIYSNNAEVYGNQAANLMKSKITDYDTMVKAANAYAECAANFAVVEYLGGDTVREMANSSVGKELTKYFKNVFVGFADSVIPDIKSVQITKYVTDGVIALGDFTANSGAQSVYNEALSKQKEYLSSTYASAKTMADKLRQNESLKFVKSLSSNYSTNITTQKWGAYYSGNGYHLGVDLGTSGNKSTTVGSIADGVVYRVVKESKSGGWGNLVIVKHTLPNGKVFYSGYAHLKSMSVSEGSTVKAGTKLGMMGSTGYSTGAHLHLLVFTGSFSKSSLPAGYVSKKISGDSYKSGGLTYYNPTKVISSQGSIIK